MGNAAYSADVIGAAARFLHAWKEVAHGEIPVILTDPAVVEVHDAARALIVATGSKDLIAASATLDDLAQHRRSS